MDEQFNKKRMFALGNWLENYLNPSIRPNEYTQLAKAAIKFYNIDFQLTKDDISLRMIYDIESQPEEVRKLILDKTFRNPFLKTLLSHIGKGGWNDPDYHHIGLSLFYKNPKECIRKIIPINNKKKTMDAMNVLFEIYKRFGELINIHQLKAGNDIIEHDGEASSKHEGYTNVEDYALGNWAYLNRELLFVYHDIKKPSIDLLKKISKSPLPWSSYFDLDLKNFDHLMAFGLFGPGDWDTAFLLISYNYMSRRLSFKNGKDVKKNVFTGWFEYANIFGMPSCLPWAAIFSKVFLDFLRHGGQKYITFCKHCGRFSLSKRLKPDGSPEKLFCSAVCRTAYKRV